MTSQNHKTLWGTLWSVGEMCESTIVLNTKGTDRLTLLIGDKHKVVFDCEVTRHQSTRVINADSCEEACKEAFFVERYKKEHSCRLSDQYEKQQ